MIAQEIGSQATPLPAVVRSHRLCPGDKAHRPSDESHDALCSHLAELGYHLHRTGLDDRPMIFFEVRRKLARQFTTLARVNALAQLLEGSRRG